MAFVIRGNNKGRPSIPAGVDSRDNPDLTCECCEVRPAYDIHPHCARCITLGEYPHIGYSYEQADINSAKARYYMGPPLKRETATEHELRREQRKALYFS